MSGLWSGSLDLSLSNTGLWSGLTGLSSNNGLWGSITYNPSLNLDFLTNTTLDPRITFSRTTNATLGDATGRVTYAPNNLVLRSEQFNDSAWGKESCTITANSAVAPDGTMTADTLVRSGTSNSRVLQSATTNANSIASVYAKAGTQNFVVFQINVASNTVASFITFDLTNGNAGISQSVLGSLLLIGSAVSVGNGWYRCSVSYETTTSSNIRIGAANAANTRNGDDGGTIFIWGAQAEQVTYQTTPSTYVQTVASAYYGPRFDYNPLTLAPRGLLIEEQRVNLALYSDQFDNAAWVRTTANVTANATTSPDGTTNADRLAGDGTSSTHNINQSLTFTAAAHTVSVYAKRDTNNFIQIRIGAFAIAGGTGFANFDLNAGTVGTIGAGLSAASITPAGNGWYRCTITGTTLAAASGVGLYVVTSATAVSAETNTLATSVFLYGAQTELGAFATSYIPTVASTVTRAADVATITGTNFSSWYNASEGTIVASADSVRPTGISPATRVFQFDDGTGNNNIRSAGTSTLTVVNATALQAFLSPNPAIPFDGTVFKFASAYKENDFASVTTGAVATDTSGTVPTVTQLALGSGTGAGILNGHIRSITYYPSRLTNAQMQELAAPPLVASLSLDFVNGSYQA